MRSPIKGVLLGVWGHYSTKLKWLWCYASCPCILAKEIDQKHTIYASNQYLEELGHCLTTCDSYPFVLLSKK